MKARTPAAMDGTTVEASFIEQRMRTDRAKNNFETLKAQHLSLQEVRWLQNSAIAVTKHSNCSLS